MTWRPKDWDYLYKNEGAERYGSGWEVILGDIYEDGADEMHKADVSWLIERIIHDDRGYVFKITDKEWQEFIK